MNEIPGEGDGVEATRERIVRTTRQAAAYQVALVGLACLAVVISSASAVLVGLSNRRLNERAKDCSEPQGQCYQQTQRTTAAAVQSVLDYIDDSMRPHRLRNEAENLCQVELFAGDSPYSRKGVSAAIDFYRACVLRRSGNTEAPPIPPNPLTTTTTGGHG